MGFEQGHPKSGGRKPSTPNKRTQKLIEILEEHGFDPVANLIEWADVAKSEFDRCDDVTAAVIANHTDSRTAPPIVEAHNWAKVGISVSLGILPYVYPKRKAAEGQESISPESAQKMTTEELVAYAEKQIEAFKGVKQ